MTKCMFMYVSMYLHMKVRLSRPERKTIFYHSTFQFFLFSGVWFGTGALFITNNHRFTLRFHIFCFLIIFFIFFWKCCPKTYIYEIGQELFSEEIPFSSIQVYKKKSCGSGLSLPGSESFLGGKKNRISP